MRESEAARVLTVAVFYDHRTLGESDAIAWARALDGLGMEECQDAVHRHYRDSTEWCMPAHVRALVMVERNREIERRHAERLHAELPPVPPVLEDGHTPGYLRAVESLRDAQ